MITLAFPINALGKVSAKTRKIFSHKRFRLTICGVLLLAQFAAPSAQAQSTVLYTALGDSIGFGLFAPIGDGYAPTYERFIEADSGARVTGVNLSTLRSIWRLTGRMATLIRATADCSPSTAFIPTGAATG